MAILHRFIGVKNHHIRLLLAYQVNSRFSRIINHTGKSRFFQLQLHEAAYSRVMFNNQYTVSHYGTSQINMAK